MMNDTAATGGSTKQGSRGRVSQALLALVLVASTFFTSVATASAADSCGEYSHGFSGTKLLNDGVSTSSGPYPISLPAGTYDVTLVSYDDHLSGAYHGPQPAEQWFVELDSGWVSAPSADIPDSQEWATTIHGAQMIPASSAITVRHLGVGNVNSVEVVCVGFTPVVEEPIVEETDVDEAEGDNSEVGESEVSETEVLGPEVEEPLVEEPETSVVVEPEVLGVTEAAPAADPVVNVVQVEPTPDPAPAAPTPTAENAAVLAATGPTDQLTILSLSGLLMIALGILLVRRESNTVR